MSCYGRGRPAGQVRGRPGSPARRALYLRVRARARIDSNTPVEA